MELRMNISDEYRLKLTQLTDLFARNRKQYNTSAYDEANTRTDFIDKFFELLGWDIRNEQGYSEQYREVVREGPYTSHTSYMEGEVKIVEGVQSE